MMKANTVKSVVITVVREAERALDIRFAYLGGGPLRIAD